MKANADRAARACEHCSTDYIPKRRDARYCSRDCGHLAKRTKPSKVGALCGAEWHARRGGGKYCSRTCARRAHHLRQVTDGRYADRVADQRAAYIPKRYTKNCEHCGSAFVTSRPQGKYCSTGCGGRAFHERRIADSHAKAMVDARRKSFTCTQCGRQVEGFGGKFCSNACQAAHEHGPDRGAKRMPMPAELREARRRLQRAARGTTGGRIVWAQGRCHRCGAPFTAPCLGGMVPAYCSDVCQRRDRNARRRALEAGARITPTRRYRVFERDGWVCQICGDPVNRDAKVPELDAPVIDHKVALAARGEHSEENWQCAHFYCNSVKRDTDLSLVGVSTMGEDLVDVAV